jgi:hypothetical protein
VTDIIWREVSCQTADELIESLSLTSNMFAGARYGHWIFRGQTNAEWGLSPGAFRQHALLRSWQHPDFENWTNGTQIFAEFDALLQFFGIADAASLPLPEDSQALRSLLREIDHERFSSASLTWPRPELWSVLAIAQHYGVPTRLLDWSRNSMKAAYFAAVGSSTDSFLKRFAVWAYHAALDHSGLITERITQYRHRVEVVTAPYADNPNLRAQEGVFTVVATDRPLGREEPADRLDLTSTLATVHDKSGESALVRLSLPANQADALLRLLAKMNISAATLFPGYAGVVTAMHEEYRWKWPKKLL